MPHHIPLVLPDTQIRAIIDAANRGYDDMPPGTLKRAADRGIEALERALKRVEVMEQTMDRIERGAA